MGNQPPDIAPETGVAPASSPEPEAITREDGATWSEKAQRWYKDGKIVAGEKPETAVPPSTASPTPEPPKVEAVAPEAPKTETPVAPEPFTFRVNGQKHAIPGLVVPPEQQNVRAQAEAAAQQQQQQMAADAQAGERQSADKAQDREFKAQEGAANRDAQMARTELQAQTRAA